jgi:hypothetical protein
MADGHMHLPSPEHLRTDYAHQLLHTHTDRELFFLELAVQAPDDESSQWLEAYADDARQDADAIATEHGLCY